MKIKGCTDEGDRQDHKWLRKPQGGNALCQIRVQRKDESPSGT